VQTGWKEPLVAFADAGDSLFPELKRAAGPTHALPQDFLPDAGTVVTFFVPFEESVAGSNKDGIESSIAWAIAYITNPARKLNP